MKIYREIISISSEEVFGLFNYPDAKFEYPVHNHPEYELNLIVNGSGNRIIGDKLDKYQDIDLVLLGPHLSHVWDNADTDKNRYPKTQCVVLQFEELFSENPLLSKLLLHPIKKMLEFSVRGIEFYGETRTKATQFLLELTELKGFERITKFLELLNFLAVSDQKKFIASAGFNSNKNSQECNRMDKVRAYIQQNYHRKLLAQEVADLINLSESAFSHFFKKSAQRTFKQYLMEIRIGKACKQLLETQYNIREICFQCGYTNLSNFNRLFKKYKGLTPLEFRKQATYTVSTVEDRFVL